VTATTSEAYTSTSTEPAGSGWGPAIPTAIAAASAGVVAAALVAAYSTNAFGLAAPAFSGAQGAVGAGIDLELPEMSREVLQEVDVSMYA